jgi:NTF2 fold immunity protein
VIEAKEATPMTLKLAQISLALLISVRAFAAHREPLPQQGVLPDEATAVKVAEVMFQPVFGAEETAKFAPYRAQLKNDVWTVYGTLKNGSRGGTPMIAIRKKDAKVLEVWHSQ